MIISGQIFLNCLFQGPLQCHFEKVEKHGNSYIKLKWILLYCRFHSTCKISSLFRELLKVKNTNIYFFFMIEKILPAVLTEKRKISANVKKYNKEHFKLKMLVIGNAIVFANTVIWYFIIQFPLYSFWASLTFFFKLSVVYLIHFN